MNTPTYTIRMPGFPGFYNSVLDGHIDREVENMEETLREKRNPRLSSPDRDLSPYLNYHAAHQTMAKEWVRIFAAHTGLELKYLHFQSPREYNFTTDSVDVGVSHETLLKLASAKDSPRFWEVLRAHFTSRDGFISFYSNDPEDEEWAKPVWEWDEIQRMALLEAWVLVNLDGLGFDSFEDLIDTCNDAEAVSNAVGMALWETDPTVFIHINELEDEEDEVTTTLVFHGTIPALVYNGVDSMELPELSHLNRGEVTDLLRKLNVL